MWVSQVALRAFVLFSFWRFKLNLWGFQKLGSFSNCSPESSDSLSCMEQFSEFAHAIHSEID